MMNRVNIVGRLTKDPELRYTPNGVPVATFTLAVNRTWVKPDENGQVPADFINCVVWRKPAENTANYLKKGSLAGVDGRIQTRFYDGQDGKRVFVTEVVAESVQFLEPKSSGNESQGNNNRGNQNQGNNRGNQSQNNNRNNGNQNGFNDYEDPFANSGMPYDYSDDDLPF